MRQIGTLPDADAARTLADYLRSLEIETRLDPEAGGWAVWVCDEDRVAQARDVLAEFTADPTNARFRVGPRPPQTSLREGVSEGGRTAGQEGLSEGRVPEPREPEGERPPRLPVTMALILACVGVGVLTDFGGHGFRTWWMSPADPDAQPGEVVQKLSLASYRVVRKGGERWIEWGEPQPPGRGELARLWYALSDVRRGELWRLVTPIFLHFSFLHLLLNMLALRALGPPIEERRGPVALVLLVLVLAVLSNLAQYFADFEPLPGWRLGGAPNFGGMSGVLYGLFGYIWVKAGLEPGLGLVMPRPLVTMMLAWFLLCWTGAVGPIGNVAHTAGLLGGLLIGYLTYWGGRLWRRLRQR